jgi:hypothetical protein
MNDCIAAALGSESGHAKLTSTPVSGSGNGMVWTRRGPEVRQKRHRTANPQASPRSSGDRATVS